MLGFVTTFIVGLLCIVLGIINMHGNISTLHSYHRHRVSEKDRIPFGKRVGLGTIIIGSGIILFSIFSAVTLYTERDVYILIGTAIMLISMIGGIIITFCAMIKYNKGIF